MLVDRSQLQFPIANFQFLNGLLNEIDLEVDFLFSILSTHVGIKHEDLADPNVSLNGDQVLSLLRLLKWLANYKMPIQTVLSHFSFSSFGVLALGTMSSSTMKDALNMAISHGVKFMPCYKLRFDESGPIPKLIVSMRTNFEEMESAALEIAVCALKDIGDQITEARHPCTIHFAHDCWLALDAEEAQAEYSEYSGCNVVFNSDFTGVSAAAEFWNLPLKNTNRITQTNALSMLQKLDSNTQQESNFEEKVFSILSTEAEEGRFLTSVQLAEMLCITPRTLSRKLAKENSSFKSILTEVRFSRAKHLLEKSSLPINVIADRVGYTDSNAFSRAFKNYTSKSPAQWRKDED